jgi:hypothetical protein
MTYRNTGGRLAQTRRTLKTTLRPGGYGDDIFGPYGVTIQQHKIDPPDVFRPQVTRARFTETPSKVKLEVTTIRSNPAGRKKAQFCST